MENEHRYTRPRLTRPKRSTPDVEPPLEVTDDDIASEENWLVDELLIPKGEREEDV